MAPLTLQQAVTQAVTASIHDSNYYTARPKRLNTLQDFELTKPQKKVEELIKKCGWAKRYVNIIRLQGSRCPWQAVYKGEVLEDPFLDKVIESIRPPTGSQRRMRMKALKLQTTIGTHALVFQQTDERITTSVYKPSNITQSTSAYGWFNISQSATDHTKGFDVPPEQVRRFWVPSDDVEDEADSEFFDILDTMERYSEACDAITAKAKQGKMMPDIFHAKLDPVADNPYWANPANIDDETGQLRVDQSLQDLAEASRAALNGQGMARFVPHVFLWPGDIEHIKLGSPIDPDMIKGANDIAMDGAIALPIPTPFLTGDDGMANHWNEASNVRRLKTETLGPALELHDEFFTRYAFRPILKGMLPEGHQKWWKGADIDQIHLVSNTAVMDDKPDNSGFLKELYELGITDRKTVADASNVDTIAELPPGVTEYEHWKTIRGVAEPEPEQIETPVEAPEQNVAASALQLLSGV